MRVAISYYPDDEQRPDEGYGSASNVSIKIVVTPIGGSGSIFTGGCTAGSCTASFTATPGPNTIAITLTDGAGGTGNTLAGYTTTSIVQPSTINSLAFTANPVVDHASLSLASNSVTAGTATNDALTVNAMDKDGNTIVGSAPYVDANGNPVSLMLNVTNSQAGGRGTVSIQGSPRIASPNQPISYAHYDGNWLDHADIVVTATSALGGSLTGTTLTTTPAVMLYSYVTNNAGHAMSYQPYGIATGSDGNLWVPETGGGAGSCMLQASTFGQLNEYCSGITGTGSYNDVLGVDGNIWFIEAYGGKIGKITPSGTIKEYSHSTGFATSIARGSDNALWFNGNSGSNNFGRITYDGKISYYTTTYHPRAIGSGPDGNIWFAATTNPILAQITPQGKETDFSYAATCSGGANEGTITGPDQNIWFVACDQKSIGRATPAGTVTLFSAGITASAGIREMTNGLDGNIWFTEFGASKIGKITPSGTVTEYPVGPYPLGITTGPDGNIWFTSQSTSKIGKLVL